MPLCARGHIVHELEDLKARKQAHGLGQLGVVDDILALGAGVFVGHGGVELHVLGHVIRVAGRTDVEPSATRLVLQIDSGILQGIPHGPASQKGVAGHGGGPQGLEPGQVAEVLPGTVGDAAKARGDGRIGIG